MIIEEIKFIIAISIKYTFIVHRYGRSRITTGRTRRNWRVKVRGVKYRLFVFCFVFSNMYHNRLQYVVVIVEMMKSGDEGIFPLSYSHNQLAVNSH